MEDQLVITGAVVRVLEVKVSGPNDFKSKAVHVKTAGEYPQTLEIQFNQGNITLLNDLPEGQKVKITANLKGREYIKEGNPLVFNSIVGWKIEKLA
jgi:pectin methylesterase-like acyl-CoA thioesterase